MFKKIGLGLAVLGAISLGVSWCFIRPWYSNWGATNKEVEQLMHRQLRSGHD